MHFFTNCKIFAKYRHKSGALKRKERAEKESKTLAQQRSLLSLGFTSQPPYGRSCTADQKPTEDQNSVQNTCDCDNSAIDDSTFTAPTESDTGATAVLDLPLTVDIIRELPTITDSIAVEDNDIGHLADFLTTEQAEVAVRRGSPVALQLRAPPKVSARAPAHRSYHFRGVKLKSCIKKIHHNLYISKQANVRIKHADTEGASHKKFGTDARVQ